LRSSCTASWSDWPSSSSSLRLLGVAVGDLAGEADGHGQRDQVLLGPVVEVALDAPPLGVAGRDHAGT
jgi:hypothetical protein